MVSLDALAFVRFGLRAPDDPRIVNTVKVIDATLKVDTPRGPAWHRYQGDGYGEHADGGPFDGTGIGRAWPLLTGERAHYELAAGRTRRRRTTGAGAWRHSRARAVCFRSRSGTAPTFLSGNCSSGTRPARRCRSCGRTPSTSSCAGPFETARSSIGRLRPFSGTSWKKATSRHIIWRFNNKVRTMPPGRTLRVETLAPAVVHWSVDGWRTVHDTATRDTTLGVHVVDLPTMRPATRRPCGSHVLLARGGPMGRDRFCRLRRLMALRRGTRNRHCSTLDSN